MFARIFLAGLLAGPLSAAIADLRITEVNPGSGQVEVTNTAADTFNITDDSVQFCQRNTYNSLRQLNGNTDVPFTPGSRFVFTVTFVNSADSDIGLFRNIAVIGDFGTAANMLHFVKWGPQSNVGRTSIAVAAGLWPTINDFVQAPATGTSITWDEGGFTPQDWYIDATPTPGSADSTTINTVTNLIAWPSGTQDFENVSTGDLVTALTGWVFVDTGNDLTRYWVRGAIDGPTAGTRPAGTSRWLRIRDQNNADSNRFYTATVNATSTPEAYIWTWYFCVEAAAPASSNPSPRFMIQHDDGGMQNFWGLELDDTNFNLVVTALGGTAASSSVQASDTGIWHRAVLRVDLTNDTLTVRIDNGTLVALAINPSVTANLSSFRFCYRGEGTDNTPGIIVDDITFQADFQGGGGGDGGDDEDEGCSTGTDSGWLLIACVLAGMIVTARLFTLRLSR